MVVFFGEFDKNELTAGPEFNVVQHTQDLSIHFGQNIQILSCMNYVNGR